MSLTVAMPNTTVGGASASNGEFSFELKAVTATPLDPLESDVEGIAELASESIVILDPAGIIRYWNPAAERLFGWPALAVCGTDGAQLSPAPGDEANAWSQLLQEGAWEGRVRRRTREIGRAHV